MRRWVMGLAMVIACLVVSATVLLRADAGRQQQEQQPPRARGGWTIPQGASEEKSPLTVNDAVLAAGKKLFASKCQRCHGPEGRGDGPDADAAHRDDMNLRLASRARQNADGVVFYKIWNGRTNPKMPTFSEDLTKQQVWAIVAYVQTLRTDK